MFAFVAEHRGALFPDEEYADLFAPAGKGRPSVPATQMAAVMTLQALHGFSDGETAEAVRFDVRWKSRSARRCDDPGFDPPTAPGNCAPRSRTPATARSSSPARCARPSPAA
jgi:hypothetical protein